MSADLPDTLRGAVDVGGDVSNVTPARLLIGRTGTAYRTSTQLQLRADHAFAKDALNATFSLDESPMKELAERFDLLRSRARPLRAKSIWLDQTKVVDWLMVSPKLFVRTVHLVLICRS